MFLLIFHVWCDRCSPKWNQLQFDDHSFVTKISRAVFETIRMFSLDLNSTASSPALLRLLRTRFWQKDSARLYFGVRCFSSSSWQQLRFSERFVSAELAGTEGTVRKPFGSGVAWRAGGQCCWKRKSPLSFLYFALRGTSQWISNTVDSVSPLVLCKNVL